jgi:hypothetical protein
MTPKKDAKSTAIIPYRENKSLLDFVMGGTPQRPKTEQEMKREKKVNRLKEIKKDISKPKQLFEYNDLKTELTGQPNPNNEIASGILKSAIKSRKARKELVDKKMNESIKQQLLGEAASKIQGLARGVKTRNKLNTDADFQSKIDMKIKKYGDAASEYSTRGKDPSKVNKEFSDIMKTMRTGLQTYKKTLGVNPKKRGPKPPQQNEF